MNRFMGKTMNIFRLLFGCYSFLIYGRCVVTLAFYLVPEYHNPSHDTLLSGT